MLNGGSFRSDGVYCSELNGLQLCCCQRAALCVCVCVCVAERETGCIELVARDLFHRCVLARRPINNTRPFRDSEYSCCHLCAAFFMAERQYVPPKRRYTVARLFNVVQLQATMYTVTDVDTSCV